ncbi:hypothetical protein [Pseudoruegeria sp. HB172150]|uniref:hypothetical protein n=1 Tax=Pseudoruegeria sp. HB172150 TaxID=2721164 RepID=UPI00155214AF|nr:hypothetical protein [Pseudoruegeria sp. HB172150]
MKARQIAFIALTAAVYSASAAAEPLEQSCRILDVVGNNRAGMVNELVEEISTRWPQSNRDGAQQNFAKLLEEQVFSGGTVYQIAKLGDDVEEHLILLRLKLGEIAGIRLLYEWSPDGMAVTNLEFKRKFVEYAERPFLQEPVALDCP